MAQRAALRETLARLPEGYDVVEGERGILAVLASHRDALVASGHGPDGGRVAPASDLAGRRALGELVVGDNERLVVRRFHHGGLLRWMNDERFGEPERPFEELILSFELARRGIATPTVVAARAQRARPGWRLALITKRVEGATDASHVLARVGTGELPAPVAERVFAALGAFVGELHGAGLVHTDLTPRNMLVDDTLLATDGGGGVWVLDLDRCGLRDALTDDERRASLARLLRYVLRRDELSAALTRPRVARFLRAYRAALGGDAIERGSEWRADWRAIAREGGRVSWVHRIGWTLENAAGGGPETRDGRVRGRS